MENISAIVVEDHQLELPPGFRFHPTDEELITHYLSKKVFDNKFSSRAIGEVDMNKVEPWELPSKAKMGEKEWFFFWVRDKKYPTGLRTNRATAAGYWKATGKDKEIFRGRCLVGMKKTLVFYRGRAPKGEKTNWISHEYRLERKLPLQNQLKENKNDWVICRVFQKSSGVEKIQIPGHDPMSSIGNNMNSILPPLMDSSPYDETMKPSVSEFGHVHCFSSSNFRLKRQENIINGFNNVAFPGTSNPVDMFSKSSLSNTFSWGRSTMVPGNYQFQGSMPVQDPSFVRSSFENYGENMDRYFKKEQARLSVSQETGLSTDINTEISSVMSNMDQGRKSLEDQKAPPSTSVGAQGLDCLWSY